MKINRLNLVVVLSILFVISAFAQDKDDEFKPSGKAFAKVFVNWHQGFGDQYFKDESSFELTRGLVGYQYQFSPRFSSKMEIDVDNPKSVNLTEVAYLKSAYLAYKYKGLEVCFGVIGMMQFKEAENNWGFRYVYKSAMDYYKFNSSTDDGLYIRYKFLDWLSADATITNGEGAKSQQDTEGKYRMGYGLSLSPLKGLSFRAYYDLLFAQEETPYDQSIYSFFLGYDGGIFRLGTEYNILYNYDFEQVDDRWIYSAYGSWAFADKFQVFGRYDYLYADYAGDTEYMMMIGFDYELVKGVKISPNYRYGDFAFKGVAGEGSYFYFNLQYKF